MPNWYRTSSMRGLDLPWSADAVWDAAKAVIDQAFLGVGVDDETRSATFESRPKILFTRRTLAVSIQATGGEASTVKLICSGERDDSMRDSNLGYRVANQLAARSFLRMLQSQLAEQPGIARDPG